MNQRGKDYPRGNVKRLWITLAAMLKLAGGKRELWASTRAIAAEADITRNAAQRNIDKLERRGILVQKYPPNDLRFRPFRRPTTYVLNPAEFRKFKKLIA